jgi:hypothetical protein
MEPVAGKPLQGEVLRTFPRLDFDPVAACIISDHKGINPVILRKIDIGFLIFFNRFGIQTVNPGDKRKQFSEVDR